MSKFYTSCLSWGKNILYRGIENGRHVQMKIPFAPTLYIKSTDKKSEWRALDGSIVEPMKFPDINEAKAFVKRYDGIEGFEVHGMTQWQYQYLGDEFPGDIDYDLSAMRIWSLDIETSVSNGFPDIATASEEILLVSIQDKATKKLIVFGTRSYDVTPEDNFEYRLFKDEASMLKGFIDYWVNNYPDIVTGWNVDQFDFPYIINRCMRVLDEDWVKRLSPWGYINERKIEIRGKEVQTYDIMGIVILDYMDLYKKFTYGAKESYALAFIAKEEGLEVQKMEYECSFKEFYTDHWNDFVRYNARDTEVVDKMDDKLKFIELTMTIAYLAKCNLKDVYGQVRVWDVFIYNYLLHKKVAIPQSKSKLSGSVEGAYVKDPQMGMKGWIVSFDFASLYPTIMRQWNISPEMLVQKVPMTVNGMVNPGDEERALFDLAKEMDCTITANGTMFKRGAKGILPEVVEVMVVGRKTVKKQMLALESKYQETHDESLVPKIAAANGKQMAYKIMANALYGAAGNAGFRYYDLRIAEAITLTGQVSNKHVEKTLNAYMNKLMGTKDVDYSIYGDTDSQYIDFDPLVQKFCKGKSIEETVAFIEKIEGQFQTVINKSIDEIYDQCNCFDKLMDMKREAIASRGFWTSKKRYAMKVHDSEGVKYDPPKIKVMGLDIVKSSTPQVVRKMLKATLPVVFDSTEKELCSYVAECKEQFFNMQPEEIAFPRSANDIEKHRENKSDATYKKGCPIHVRAALLYNRHTEKYREQYQSIGNGDKIKFIYLIEPNPIREDVIGFLSSGKFPKETGLEPYINKDLMWEKTFLNPLQGITDAIGWQIEEQSSLEDFFG